MTVPRTPALDRICADLREAARESRRQNRINIATVYRRERHLRDVAPWLCERPMSPFRKVHPGWLNDRPETTRALLADLMYHIRHRFRERERRGRAWFNDPRMLEQGLDALRGALRAEIVRYRQQVQREAA